MQIVNDKDYTETLHSFIRRAIDSGRGLHERDGDGRTALHWAAANGHQVCCSAKCAKNNDLKSALYVLSSNLQQAGSSSSLAGGRCGCGQCLLVCWPDPTVHGSKYHSHSFASPWLATTRLLTCCLRRMGPHRGSASTAAT